KESWNESTQYGKYLQARLEDALDDEEDAALELLKVFDQKQKAKDPSSRFVLEYVYYRLLYRFGLVRPAQRGFDALVASTPSRHLVGVRAAALVCLNAIRAAIPTLGPSDRAVAAMSALLADPALPASE